ncbi:Uncharacterised protein [Mycobacteroides abscessus subsp. abscessus]|nr:Uncharacterised protein [Mycobacteroides abscessus subsp. abscessus]
MSGSRGGRRRNHITNGSAPANSAAAARQSTAPAKYGSPATAAVLVRKTARAGTLMANVNGFASAVATLMG